MKYGLLLAVIAFSLVLESSAQLTTQVIELNPGWNSVWLEVQPEPRTPGLVFAGAPVESVWMWNRQFSPVQYLADASQLKPEDPSWLAYLPSGLPGTNALRLNAVLGCKAYLIKSTNSTPFTLRVQGVPFVRSPAWIPDSLNLVGFHVGSGASTFSSILQPEPALRGSPVYRLAADGSWLMSSAPNSDLVRPGEAFWTVTSGATSYGGPIGLALDQIDRIDFGRTLTEVSFKVQNLSSGSSQLLLNLLSSERPADPTQVGAAGDVQLSIWLQDSSSRVYGWYRVTNNLSLGVFGPREQKTVRLSARRRDFGVAVGDASFQSIVEVRNADRSAVRWIPVNAQPALSAATALPTTSVGRLSAQSAPNPNAGLWVGDAIINAVTQIGLSDETPQPTPTELQFRLIIHVGVDGQARLLQRVYQVTTNGAAVLVTDESKLAAFQGALIRDGVQTGRRISSVAFGFTNPQDMGGQFADASNPLTCSVAMDYDDPLNPFKHRFHPDHNNLSEDYRKRLPEGKESYSFTRALSLAFATDGSQDGAIPDPGSKTFTGVYRETITGIHQKTIRAQGSFRLTRVSTVGILNAGL